MEKPKNIFGRKPTIVVGIAAALVSMTLLPVLPGFCNEKNTNGQGQEQKGRANNVKSPNPEDLFIVQLTDGADQEKFDSFLQEVHGTVIRTLEFSPKVKLLVIQAESGRATELEKKLRSNKDIAKVQPNLKFYANDVPNDPYFSTQWDLGMMNYTRARSSFLQQEQYAPATIFFLDSGLSPLPNELGYFSAYQFNCTGANPTGAKEQLFDSGFHGTATASVCCDTNNNIGIAGVANFARNRCTLIEYRITYQTAEGQSATYLYNIVAALYDIYSNPYNLPWISPGPINLSYGAAPPNTLNSNPVIQQLAQLLSQKGYLLVLAAGNDGSYDNSPELYARRVAAVAPNGTLASFSDNGPFSAAAPGVNIPLYKPTTGASPVFGNGTSFAAPRWCAAIADVMAVLPPQWRTATFADQIVSSTATVFPGGWHVPNLAAAINYALPSSQQVAVSASPNVSAKANTPATTNNIDYPHED